MIAYSAKAPAQRPMTRSPTDSRSTPAPSFATSPAPSTPAGLAAPAFACNPNAGMNSPRLSPAACMRTSTCPGAGSGTATSRRSSSVRSASAWIQYERIACGIFAIIALAVRFEASISTWSPHMPHVPASTALTRFRILDLSRVRAGPTCVKQFADFGADVIKIESPPGVDPNEGMSGPRSGFDMQNLHRNKRSMTLNLKLPEGRDVFARLVKTADVVVENYRPDVKFRLGIDYASLERINPRVILASISGFGQDGPYRERPGFDQIAQGMSGLMSVTGFPGQGPVRTGTAIADLAAGLFAALGIMTALLERESSGKGQWVQSSLLQSGVALLDFQAARYLMNGEVPPQVGNDHPTSMPTSAYKTADSYINVGASGDGMWARL